MKWMTGRNILLAGLLLAGIISCDKQNSGFNPQGGNIPTNYINILDSSFSPAVLTIAIGSSITFVNSTNTIRTIVSDDSVTIITPGIPAFGSYFYKKDTIGTFNYHCVEKPSARGTVVLRP